MTPCDPADADMIDALSRLHTRTVDARQGYETMLAKAEPEFRPVVQQFHDLHSRQATDLARIITALGGTPDPEGSLMGTVNRTVVSLRAVFDEIDEDVMDAIRDGEARILEAFDSALSKGPAQSWHGEVQDMREALLRLLAATSHLD